MRTLAGLVFSIVVLVPVTTVAADKDDIVAVVTEAYVNGVHAKFDPAAMRRGFHPDFRMLVLADGKLTGLPLEDWIARMEKGAASATRPTITHEIPQVHITGTAATAQVELSRNGRHTFTDYLSLYKFADGWKIVSKTFYSHPRE